MEADDVPLQRLFLAEKWLVTRLLHGHVDPREGGVGNIVNCGAAMYMAPVGIVNAADPARAYGEAIEITGAHQSSYGREAAGVMAAAVAAAMAADATAESVVATCLSLARDGTHAAIESVIACARSLGAVGDDRGPGIDWGPVLSALRESVAPFDTVGPTYREPGLGARRPSRLHAIEELPVALGLVAARSGCLSHRRAGRHELRAGRGFHRRHGGGDRRRSGGSVGGPHGLASSRRAGQPARPRDTCTGPRRGGARGARRGRHRGTGASRRVRRPRVRMTLRVTWVQPEDLLRHELLQSAAEGRDVAAIRARWMAAGGTPEPPVGGASPDAASPELTALARELLAEIERLPAPGADPAADELPAIEGASRPVDRLPWPDGLDLEDRIAGGWLGRAVGCLLGKPVEKVPRQGIREILEATGRWPLDRYFTAVGLPADVAERWPWNRASRTTSLEEHIDGMPEDDDLNYALLALTVLELHGEAFDTEDVAKAWLDLLPGGRVFTAERVAYRNLLDGLRAPDTARVGNPYREWIGAQIRTDVYGWTHPGQPRLAAELAWRDARLSHTRDGSTAPGTRRRSRPRRWCAGTSGRCWTPEPPWCPRRAASGRRSPGRACSAVRRAPSRPRSMDSRSGMDVSIGSTCSRTRRC